MSGIPVTAMQRSPITVQVKALPSCYPASTVGEFASPQSTVLLNAVTATIHLFKTNHPRQGFSSSSDFYLQLLEFLLLFTHQRGGPSTLSSTSYQSALNAGQQNIQQRVRRWLAYEASEFMKPEDRDLLATGSEQYVGNWLSVEDDPAVSSKERFNGVPLVDLLPRFMEISAQTAQLTKQSVTDMWLELANDFMLQAAIEVGLTGPISTRGSKINHKALLACFGWGIPTGIDRLGIDDDWDSSSTEAAINHMLLPNTNEKITRENAWIEKRRRTVAEFMEHIRPENEEARGPYLHEDDVRCHVTTLQYGHPADRFEVQMLDYIRNLQVVWAQLTEEPILLQIEQGGLKGLDDDEFQALLARVNDDEHQEHLYKRH